MFKFIHRQTVFSLLFTAALVIVPNFSFAEDTAPTNSVENPFPLNLAVKAEGYFAGKFASIDGRGTNTNANAVTAGGSASVSMFHNGFYGQIDLFGDISKFYEFNVSGTLSQRGAGAHFGWRDPNIGSLGIAAAYTNLDLSSNKLKLNRDLLRLGGEAEYYFHAFTVGIQGGILDPERVSFEPYYIKGTVIYYPTADLKLAATGGIFNLDIPDINQLGFAGASLEYKLKDNPLSIFTRWQGTFYGRNGATVDAHRVSVGFKLNFDGQSSTSLKRFDRAHFQDVCLGLIAGIGC